MGLINSKNIGDKGLLPPLLREEAIKQSLIRSGLADENSFGEAENIYDWCTKYQYQYSENDMKIIRKSLHSSCLI